MDRESRLELARRLREGAHQVERPPDRFELLPARVGSEMLLALARLVEATGECRVGPGEAVLVPVLEQDGLRWECSHPETHRSGVVAPLG